MNGYPIDTSHLDLDVYRLLLPFAASHRLHDLCGSDASDPLNRMREQFERSEACRLLITIAATVRNSFGERPDSLVRKHLDAPVGTLVKDLMNPEGVSLSFLEACHKIIPATDIEFLLEQAEDERLEPLTMQSSCSERNQSERKRCSGRPRLMWQNSHDKHTNCFERTPNLFQRDRL